MGGFNLLGELRHRNGQQEDTSLSKISSQVRLINPEIPHQEAVTDITKLPTVQYIRTCERDIEKMLKKAQDTRSSVLASRAAEYFLLLGTLKDALNRGFISADTPADEAIKYLTETFSEQKPSQTPQP